MTAWTPKSTGRSLGAVWLVLATVGLVACVLAILTWRGLSDPASGEIRVFHAAGLTPLMDSLQAGCRADLNATLQAEASGSLTAARKLADLHRSCDLIMLADNALVVKMLSGQCSWRIDFANDAVVLGVGARAAMVDKAEENWTAVLLDDNVRIARVDENLGPIGYRTLLVWKLQERRGYPGLYDKLLAKADMVVDHVSRLTPLLKVGEIDYAFVYRSVCIASDVRYIELDEAINLSSTSFDYSSAVVSFPSLGAEVGKRITVVGQPITWTLSIPDNSENKQLAVEFVAYILSKGPELIEKAGFRPMAPARYYGPASQFAPFNKSAHYAGVLR